VRAWRLFGLCWPLALLPACGEPSITPPSDAGTTGGTATGGTSTGGSATGGTTSSGGTPSSGGQTPGGGSPSTGGSATGGSGSDEYAQLLGEFDAFWDFETEANGTVQSIVSEHTLTLAGAAVEPGPTGNQLSLSGLEAVAESDDPIVNTTGSFSVSAWVKLDELDAYDTFVAANGAEVSSFYLQKRDNERLSFTTLPSDDSSATACVVTAEIQPRAGEWYHVVATVDSQSGQRLYVDGVLSGQLDCTAGVFEATEGLSVGRGHFDGVPVDPLSGAVDDLGLISRLLTPEEVFLLYRTGRPEAQNFLFAYFVEVSQGRGDGLRLAHSHDGYHFGAIGGGKVFMPPEVGGGSFRDPHLMRDPEGTYHLVWTTTCVPWAESNCVQDRGFGHASSPNLVAWSEQDYVTIDLNVEHVWAPETFYDSSTSQYMVYWSSPLDQNASASDPHSIYYVLTSDFDTFTDPEVLYGQSGRNFIDATIRADDDGFLMVLKDEADGQKNLRALRSAVPFGAWTGDPSAPLTGSYAAEGPSLLERGGELFLYFDKYGEGAYGALRATAEGNPDTPGAWQDISSSVFFPGVRHGTPIEVPWDVYEAVALAAGE
jgi:phage protein U